MSSHYPLSITERRKLVTALAEARRALEAAAPSGPLPSSNHADRFRDYSSAMCNLVTHCLSAAESAAEWALEHWSWDGYKQEFYFDYAGRCQLARSDRHRDYDLMRCRAHMSLDPAKDLEGELTRLGALAARYRERVEHLEVETLRAYIYPEGEPARGRPTDAQPRPPSPARSPRRSSC
jgi:hypothetical protein